jgi:hypothetical protein
MAGQLWLATHDDAPSLRPLTPFSGSGPDQITLKLSQASPPLKALSDCRLCLRWHANPSAVPA